MSIPGVGPVCATALEALSPPPKTIARGRDFAAWLGLTPRQNSSGGKARLGRISRMGQRRPEAAAYHRRDGCGAMGSQAGRSCRVVACPYDGEKAPNACGDCAGEQDRPDRLGADGERRGLPESGRGRLRAEAAGAAWMWWGQRRIMGKRSRRRGRENQLTGWRLERG